MKILIISGTPKDDGLCASLVNAAAGAGGADCAVVTLPKLKIEGCRICGDGWGLCRDERNCVIDDDFNRIKDSLPDYDSFVLITPVYWGEVSDVMKHFIDRLRRCEAGNMLQGKKFILVASAGGSGGGILFCLEQMQRFVAAMGAGVYDYIGINRWNSAYKREALVKAVQGLLSEL